MLLNFIPRFFGFIPRIVDIGFLRSDILSVNFVALTLFALIVLASAKSFAKLITNK